LNISTHIGGTNFPAKVSPVPHIIVSTLDDLCNMIKCNLLNKDFVKILLIDDVDDIFKNNGFSNHIRHVLLFLNNDRQLIVASTSKLEEIIDHFVDLMHDPEYIIVPDERPSLDGIYYFISLIINNLKL